MLGALIADGRTSEVFRFGADGAAKVLKPDTPTSWARIEADHTAAVRQLGVPAPEVRDVIEVDGRPAVIFERIEGLSMWQRIVDRPGDAAALAREFVDIQRTVLTAGVPDGLPSLTDRLRGKVLAARQLEHEERDDAVELLGSLPVGGALLHGDFHPGNILLGASGPIVIDWFDAAVGHPAADIARTMLLLKSTGATDLRHLPEATQPLLGRVFAEYCGRALTTETDRLDDWFRLRVAGRLAEQTDLDPSGLVALWRDGALERSM